VLEDVGHPGLAERTRAEDVHRGLDQPAALIV
jgi:hypothetical protein